MYYTIIMTLSFSNFQATKIRKNSVLFKRCLCYCIPGLQVKKNKQKMQIVNCVAAKLEGLHREKASSL